MAPILCVSLRKTLRPLRLIFFKFLDCVKFFLPFSMFDVQCSMFDVQSLKLARRALSPHSSLVAIFKSALFGFLFYDLDFHL
jgi:hypothetical protein